MSNLLFLAHRLPYPPNKGDKVRSYHLLKALARDHRVFLGTFVDDRADAAYVGNLAPLCAGLHVEPLRPAAAKVRSLTGLLTGEALTLPYYRDGNLARWVRRTVAEQGIDTAVAFSSPMAQYVEGLPGVRLFVDLVDVDSAKWQEYSRSHHWPSSWIYAREGRRLLAAERAIAARAERSFLVTPAEVALFSRLAPECAGRVDAIGNGVDSEYFAPQTERLSPYAAGETPVVFTGAMDYWPNVDAVTWFADAVLPALRARRPDVRFYIVGMRPAPAVEALASDAIVVTGGVPDVRPYVQHAAIAVAPLRVARGIQNKVLEAMAMGKAVVTSRACAGAIEGATDDVVTGVGSAGAFVDAIDALLADPARAQAQGAAGRRFIAARHSWDRQLEPLLRRIAQPAAFAASPFARGHEALAP
ncbi:MAG TPA: TIGR03087 family PEP-CTERM/XrtA system glycosyltransferase [Burkholderiales bacterium]|nr:TIGR03087 family PEP-CTERM/XrtA system glycosyltransferase [Burkholderiales bacterium]